MKNGGAWLFEWAWLKNWGQWINSWKSLEKRPKTFQIRIWTPRKTFGIIIVENQSLRAHLVLRWVLKIESKSTKSRRKSAWKLQAILRHFWNLNELERPRIWIHYFLESNSKRFRLLEDLNMLRSIIFTYLNHFSNGKLFRRAIFLFISVHCLTQYTIDPEPSARNCTVKPHEKWWGMTFWMGVT